VETNDNKKWIYCPKCKQENLINVRQQQIIVIEPNAKT